MTSLWKTAIYLVKDRNCLALRRSPTLNGSFFNRNLIKLGHVAMKSAFSTYFVIMLLPSHSLISRRKMHQPFGPVSLHRERERAQYKNTEKHQETRDTENYPHNPSEIERGSYPLFSPKCLLSKTWRTSLMLLFSSLQLVQIHLLTVKTQGYRNRQPEQY